MSDASLQHTGARRYGNACQQRTDGVRGRDGQPTKCGPTIDVAGGLVDSWQLPANINSIQTAFAPSKPLEPHARDTIRQSIAAVDDIEDDDRQEIPARLSEMEGEAGGRGHGGPSARAGVLRIVTPALVRECGRGYRRLVSLTTSSTKGASRVAFGFI
ncbi:hypothetical protein BJ912DRAFT_1045023 [Pholiota molesta]|nr:hypothetical protein BJ912DRAFT_1045023 [Pholiota molesta]